MILFFKYIKISTINMTIDLHRTFKRNKNQNEIRSIIHRGSLTKIKEPYLRL